MHTEHIPSYENSTEQSPLERYSGSVKELVEAAHALPLSFSVEKNAHINPNGSIDISAFGHRVEEVSGLSAKEFMSEFPRETGMSAEADDKSWKVAVSLFDTPLNPASTYADKIKSVAAVIQEMHPDDLSVANKTFAVIIGQEGIAARTDDLDGQRNGTPSLSEAELLVVFDDILGKVEERIKAAQPDEE